MNSELLRYPIGRFVASDKITKADRELFISDIESIPDKIKGAVAGLTDKQLDTRYRPDGWTLR